MRTDLVSTNNSLELRQQFPRFCALIDSCDSDCEEFRSRFERFARQDSCVIVLWETVLRRLDPHAWQWLQAKARCYVSRRDEERGFQQVFDALGEGLAYGHLLDLGCEKVRFIAESENETPDLEGVAGNQRVLCEFKTINISEEEVAFRRHPGVVRHVSKVLPGAFFGKLDSVLGKAKSQLKGYDPNREARWLIYINIKFDYWPVYNRADYCEEISSHCRLYHSDVELVFAPSGY